MKPLYLALIGSLFLGACTASQPPLTTNQTPSPAPTADISNAIPTYTLTEVSQHAIPADCWLAISGKVYNVSNFAEKHPGGEAVYQGCGQDATTFFETRPMGSGNPHSDKARSLLPNFYIGSLSQ